MSRRTILATAAIAVGAGVLVVSVRRRALRPVGNHAVPQPAKAVDLERYSGRWYELARYENWFERGCEGVTADYALRADGLIEVINSCRDGVSGKLRRTSRGRATIVPASDNSKLKVSFFGRLFSGNYWVLDRDDDYNWSIVGEPSGRFLWILSRDPLPGSDVYEQLLRRVGSLGYDTGYLRRTTHYPI